jgi:DNA repair exonuclease SbcCD ATPase subunit
MISFLKHYFEKKAENVQNGFTKLLVEFDPQTASEAEIGELDEALTKLTQQMVGAKNAWDKELRQSQEIQKNYDLRLSAAERLQAKSAAAPSPEEKAQVEASLAKLLDELEKMAPEVQREAQEAKESQGYYEELNQAVKTASERLKTARERLSDAQRRMDLAKVRMERAKEQEDQAMVLSGIKKQASSIGTAFEAMSKRADEMETQAEVHRQKAQLLTPPQGGDDPLIAAALKEASGDTAKPQQSLADRLAALKK